ncbi:MAG: hypothetical protein ACFFAS_04860 [Promethearchaeota archaeon]
MNGLSTAILMRCNDSTHEYVDTVGVTSSGGEDAIPGFDLMVVFGVLGVGFVILIRSRQYNRK